MKILFLFILQFLGPALKGIYAYGFLPNTFSGEKLSGLNFSGFGNTFGSRCNTYEEIRHVVPAGTKYSPGKKSEIKMLKFFKKYSRLYCMFFYQVEHLYANVVQ